VSAKTLVHRVEFRGAAKAAFDGPNARDPEVLLSGPAGTGKSFAALTKLHMMALINPGMRGLIVRKTATSLTSTALVTFREQVAQEAIATGIVTWFGGSAQEAASYRYSNGSIIAVGGMDKATRIMSSEYDVAYVQEAIELTENDWEAITTRLRNGRISFQQIIADTNPDVPTHWLKQRGNAGRTTFLESRHEDNPMMYNDDGTPTERGVNYLAKLDALTGPRLQRLRYGAWVAAEGQIFEGYDAAVHLIDPFDIPREWPRYWSIDFGYTNPFVCSRYAEDPDGRLYLYAEIYQTKTLVEDHASILKGILKREPRPHAIICDHDAEDRATLTRHLGISTRAARKGVSDGLQAVGVTVQAGRGRQAAVVHPPRRRCASRPGADRSQETDLHGRGNPRLHLGRRRQRGPGQARRSRL